MRLSYGVLLDTLPRQQYSPDRSTPLLIQTKPLKIPACITCKAYMNCYNKFVCNGNNYICCLCKTENRLSSEYFCQLENEVRTDINEKPELNSSSFTMAYNDRYSQCYVVWLESSPTNVLCSSSIFLSRHTLRSSSFTLFPPLSRL